MVRETAYAARQRALLVNSRRMEVNAGKEWEERASFRKGRKEERRYLYSFMPS